LGGLVGWLLDVDSVGMVWYGLYALTMHYCYRYPLAAVTMPRENQHPIGILFGLQTQS